MDQDLKDLLSALIVSTKETQELVKTMVEQNKQPTPSITSASDVYENILNGEEETIVQYKILYTINKPAYPNEHSLEDKAYAYDDTRNSEYFDSREQAQKFLEDHPNEYPNASIITLYL